MRAIDLGRIQHQARPVIDRAHPLGRIIENVWVPTDLSGVAAGKGTRVVPHADVTVIRRKGRLAFYNNDANEAGTAASILPLAFPWVQFAQFYVDAVPGFVATIPTMISGSGSNSFIQCGSSNLVSAGCRFNFGTQRYCDITITGASGTGLLLSAIHIVRSATDQVFYCNGLSATNTLSPGTLGNQLTSAGSPLGTMNGAVLLSGYGRGMPDADYALWLSKNPDAWPEMFEPQRIWVPVSAAAPTSYTLTAAAGSFALTGNAAALLASRKLTAAAGSFALTGNAAGLYLGRRLSAAAASYAWTGNAASLVTSRRLAAAAGAYVLTGNAAALRLDRLLAAASGSYTFTGNDASLVHSAPGSYSLTANAGAYSLTGNAAALRADRRLTAADGVFNLTGSVAQLLRGYQLAAAAGSFAFTGNAATLSASQSYSLSAAASAYALTGNAATLTYSGEVFTDSEFWKYTIPAQNLLYTVPAQNLVYQVPPAGLTFTI